MAVVGTNFRGGLQMGEEIRWTGRPAQGLLFVPKDRSRTVQVALYLGLGSAWILFIGDGDFVARLIALLFALTMLYYLVGRFFLDAWLRKSLFYAVTNRRALIVRTKEPMP